MGVIVAFNWSTWAVRFPELAASLTPDQASSYFDEAGLYQANDGSGPICDATQQLMLLNLLTAHIAYLYRRQAGALQSALVGRISDATQGSVSVSVDMGDPHSDFQAWLNSSPYGASYWIATRQFRTFRYRRGVLSTRGL